jgi:LytS/YehU family sensor histidine kinase
MITKFIQRSPSVKKILSGLVLAILVHSGCRQDTIECLEPTFIHVVKHSGARSFRFSIHVNGRGFNPEKLKSPGNGLVNMKNRMKDFGRTFQITSRVGKGR